jgi:hypothetical protein
MQIDQAQTSILLSSQASEILLEFLLINIWEEAALLDSLISRNLVCMKKEKVTWGL